MLHVEEPGAPPVQDEIHAAERASTLFAEQAPHAIPREVPAQAGIHAEAQAAIRFVEQVQRATLREVPARAAIRHGSRGRDEIQREAQQLRAIPSLVFLSAQFAIPSASPPSTWLHATRYEKAWFWIRVLCETRFVPTQFAIRFEKQLLAIQSEKELFATRSLERRPCGSPELPDSMRCEIRTLAMPSRSEQSAL